jgi:hypothetical protein
MTDPSTSLTITAHRPEPYVHLDNRGLVICNGLRCVLVPAANLRWAAETCDLIATEERAGSSTPRKRPMCSPYPCTSTTSRAGSSAGQRRTCRVLGLQRPRCSGHPEGFE